jgi:hypothetical protein
MSVCEEENILMVDLDLAVARPGRGELGSTVPTRPGIKLKSNPRIKLTSASTTIPEN